MTYQTYGKVCANILRVYYIHFIVLSPLGMITHYNYYTLIIRQELQLYIFMSCLAWVWIPSHKALYPRVWLDIVEWTSPLSDLDILTLRSSLRATTHVGVKDRDRKLARGYQNQNCEKTISPTIASMLVWPVLDCNEIVMLRPPENIQKSKGILISCTTD